MTLSKPYYLKSWQWWEGVKIYLKICTVIHSWQVTKVFFLYSCSFFFWELILTNFRGVPSILGTVLAGLDSLLPILVSSSTRQTDLEQFFTQIWVNNIVFHKAMLPHSVYTWLSKLQCIFRMIILGWQTNVSTSIMQGNA